MVYVFSIEVEGRSELREVSAPDALRAAQTLARWRPGVHVVKFEGCYREDVTPTEA